MTCIIRWTRGGEMVSATLPETVTVDAARIAVTKAAKAGVFGFTDADGYRVIFPWPSFVDIVFSPEETA